ncbi:hypothetical protein [Phyllobacterium sp. YR531]|uniref:TY-Chap domain-containing protein n=1 Tax=Phyllobacterium sp. YR531 TaxID=1144343 RepID=UPI00026F9033|nr:hypothetical protein [Phyllobacterium sp. YR531]EJN01410.1 hypothetical protein PMI41_03492 [Phyllobacterium sp. YR531]
MRFYRIALFVSIMATSGGFSVCHATDRAAPTDLAIFIERYRCPVIARLATIHSNAGQETELDRYLILSTGHSQRYVQCRFIDNDKRMLCEASSGFFGPKEGEAGHYRMRSEGIEALARLGFSTDGSQGNYQTIVDGLQPSTYAKVAELLLSALFDGHGLSAESQIMINMARDHERKIEDCSNLPSG